MTLLSRITPVMLTMNEEANLERTLSRLQWARDIVVVDSGSTDRTLDILDKDPRVRVFQRVFDTHAGQWRFATCDTAIDTEWILRLDADYRLTDELIAELESIEPDDSVAAYRIAFKYAIFSRDLRSSLYPPNWILMRRGRFEVFDRGHTEAWRINGKIADLNGKVVHDDWKSMSYWVNSQSRYMARELAAMPVSGGLKHQLRRLPPAMPLVAFCYAYFLKGLFLDGRAGLYYALQRATAEMILALMVLEERLKPKDYGHTAADPD